MKHFLVIVPDGGMLFEAAGIADILMHANLHLPVGVDQPRYRVSIATTQSHQVIHGQSGLNLLADLKLAELDPRAAWDTIMITGRGDSVEEGNMVVDFIRLAAPQARRVVSICGGAMLLAEAGLLDRRRAPPHRRLLTPLQPPFPRVPVEGGPLYIPDRPLWTSGGVGAGSALPLALAD